MLSIGTTLINLLQTVFKTLLEIIILTGTSGSDPDPAIGNVFLSVELSLLWVERINIDSVDAADVDCWHGPIGGHGPLGSQFLQTGQGTLGRERMGVATGRKNEA